MAVQILSACREAPCIGPSEIRALDFKREFPRSAICSISASIGSNRSIFSLRPPPASYRRFQKDRPPPSVLSSRPLKRRSSDRQGRRRRPRAGLHRGHAGLQAGRRHRLDALIVRTVPGVRKAGKWNYGAEGRGWFLSQASLVYWPAPSWPLPAKPGRRTLLFVPATDADDWRMERPGTTRALARISGYHALHRASAFAHMERADRGGTTREPLLPVLCRRADRRHEKEAGCRASPPRQADHFRDRG